jgi:hypothetical protein
MQINVIYLLTLSSRLGIACLSGLDSPTTFGVMIMLEAHYTQGKQPTLCIAITNNGQRTWVAERIKVEGKREARKVAAQHNATPWNF